MSADKDLELALIKRGSDSKYAPPSPLNPDLSLFYDYLISMETFIEAEIQSYHKDFEFTVEKFKSGEIQTSPDLDDMPFELQEISYYLGETKDFAHILRSSFFINLYTYVETYVLHQYYESGGERLKRQIIVEAVKFMAKGLVDVNKIPQWREINRHIDIRNCLVHRYGRLGPDEDTDGKSREKNDSKNKREGKVRFTCLTCGQYVLGKPKSNILCGECSNLDSLIPMEEGKAEEKSRDVGKNIREYAKGKSTLMKIERRMEHPYPYDKQPFKYDQIILEKGFCEHAVEVVDNFLYSIRVIREKRARLT